MDILAGYTSSIFQDFENCVRTEVDLVEDDIRLVSDEYKSSCVTHELPPGIYCVKIFSEVLLWNLNSNMEESTTRLILNLIILA